MMKGARASIIDAIGGTAIVKLNKVAAHVKSDLFVKCEYLNPGGSMKDRVALSIIRDAENRGLLTPGGTIVEATSGNTGAGLAMIGALRGYKCIFVMPDKMSIEKIANLRALGAKVVLCPTAVEPEDPRSYYEVTKRIVQETPGAYHANQYHNPANPDWAGRDRFVLSAGHSSITLYTQLYLAGFGLEIDDLQSLRTWGSKTPGHPEHGHTAGVETTTGPLGQGVGNAIGMAMAARRERGLFDPDAAPGESLFDHQIYAICSDGDLEEGVSAEASSLAGTQQLAGDATLLYYMGEEAQEGKRAYLEKRKPDFDQFPKRP